MPEVLFEIFNAFQIATPMVSSRPHGSGHIHATYLVETATGERYILQRLNTHVFPRPEALMANLAAICDHMSRKVEDPARQALRPVPVRDGGLLVEDVDGGAWRAFHFIPGCRSIERPESDPQAFEIGRAFGAFYHQLSDLPFALEETIPRFHDTPWRFDQLRTALAADPLGRARAVEAEVDFALARSGEAGRILGKLAAGEIPTRPVHNDAKASNLLLDAETGVGLCVVDLDTVMPGTALCDFGELVRSGIGESAEDEAGAGISLSRFRAMAQGYIAGAADLLTAAEMEEMPFAGRLMALENGVRFLTDHLEGDVYYRTARLGHNLARARAQFELVRMMEKAEGEMLETFSDRHLGE